MVNLDRVRERSAPCTVRFCREYRNVSGPLEMSGAVTIMNAACRGGDGIPQRRSAGRRIGEVERRPVVRTASAQFRAEFHALQHGWVVE